MHLHSDVIELAAAVGQSLLLRVRCKRTRILLYIYMNSCMNIHTNAHYVQATTLCVTLSRCALSLGLFVSLSLCFSVSLSLCAFVSTPLVYSCTYTMCVSVCMLCVRVRVRVRVCVYMNSYVNIHTNARYVHACIQVYTGRDS